MERVDHCFEPVYDKNSRILILGTMPSPASRERGFYYSHPRNRFWQVMSALTGSSFPKTPEDKRRMALENGIALWDVLGSCDIRGASDASIKNASPNDIPALLRNTGITAVATTGVSAGTYYKRYFGKLIGLPHIELPSTSPANAGADLNSLISKYEAILPYIKANSVNP